MLARPASTPRSPDRRAISKPSGFHVHRRTCRPGAAPAQTLRPAEPKVRTRFAPPTRARGAQVRTRFAPPTRARGAQGSHQVRTPTRARGAQGSHRDARSHAGRGAPAGAADPARDAWRRRAVWALLFVRLWKSARQPPAGAHHPAAGGGELGRWGTKAGRRARAGHVPPRQWSRGRKKAPRPQDKAAGLSAPSTERAGSKGKIARSLGGQSARGPGWRGEDAPATAAAAAQRLGGRHPGDDGPEAPGGVPSPVRRRVPGWRTRRSGPPRAARPRPPEGIEAAMYGAGAPGRADRVLDGCAAAQGGTKPQDLRARDDTRVSTVAVA